MLRALDGIADNSGRTIVLAGPTDRRKTEFLDEIRAQVATKSARVIDLRGPHRGNGVAYSALEAFLAQQERITEIENEILPTHEEVSRRGPETISGGHLGIPDSLLSVTIKGVTPPRDAYIRPAGGGHRLQAGRQGALWQRLVQDFRSTDSNPIVILADDAAYLDSESRECLLFLSKKARLRPLLLTLSLDTTRPESAAWEDSLLGRGDVDWIRFARPTIDRRAHQRQREIFRSLPPLSQRIVGYCALMGGSVGEIVLRRVSLLNFEQLHEAINPLVSGGLALVSNGKIAISPTSEPAQLAELIPEATRREMHLEIAEALSALNPEPPLDRRVDIARHYLAWYPGPMALVHLRKAAELSGKLLAFDQEEELLSDAIRCVPSLQGEERNRTEAEVRILHARSLLACGRLTEAGAELREAVSQCLQFQIPAGTVAEWIENLIPLLAAIGPRPSLETDLKELADRCHDGGADPIAALFETLITAYDVDRCRTEMADAESRRAANLVRKTEDKPAQALGLLAVGISRLDGSAEEQRRADRLLEAARVILHSGHREVLEEMAAAYQARLAAARGAVGTALRMHEKALSSVQRLKLHSLELDHQLGIAQIQLDRRFPQPVDSALRRAREITDLLHLIPPAAGLYRLWLLEGRRLAKQESFDLARDRWQAIIDQPTALVLPRIKSEAMVRLAMLELVTKRLVEAEAYINRLWSNEMVDGIPARWKTWLPDIELYAPSSEAGSGPLPTAPHPRGG